MQRIYHYSAVDPVALAQSLGVPFDDVSLRLGVTADWARRLAKDARHTHRVRRAVLEVAVKRERMREALDAAAR